VALSHPYQYIESADRLPQIAEEVASADVVSTDLETHGMDVVGDAKIRLWSVNTGRGVYVIDLYKVPGVEKLVQAYRDTKAVHVLQNGKYDQKFFLRDFDLELLGIFDTFRASAVLYNGKDNHANDLYSIYARELQIGPETPDLGGSDWNAGTLTKDQIEYAAEDVTHLPRVRDALKKKLAAMDLIDIAKIECGAILPEAAVELNGFKLDTVAWGKLAAENQAGMERLQTLLWKTLPNPSEQLMLFGDPHWNLDSTDQLLVSLRKMGLSKLADTQEMTLAMHAAEYPIIKEVIDFRGFSKNLSSFGLDYTTEHIHKKTGRIHADFYPFLKAGRYGCSRPNLAQIPRDKRFRKCFVAEDGYIYVLSDYSNIEMRIAAEISRDPTLMRVFREGKDAHRFTASVLKSKSEQEVTKDERQQAKPVNFGFLYGMGAAKLVLYAQANYGVTLTLKQAEDFRGKFFERFDGLRRWHEKTLRDGERFRVSRSLGKRIRYIENEKAHNEFLNTPVQATGADGLKKALRLVYNKLKKRFGKPPVRTLSNPSPTVMMVHHVHDEIILEPKDQPEVVSGSKEDLETGMREGMQPFLKFVPVEVEATSGHSWADKA
jgi:DNA polymerase I